LFKVLIIFKAQLLAYENDTSVLGFQKVTTTTLFIQLLSFCDSVSVSCWTAVY